MDGEGLFETLGIVLLLHHRRAKRLTGENAFYIFSIKWASMAHDSYLRVPNRVWMPVGAKANKRKLLPRGIYDKGCGSKWANADLGFTF